MIIEALEVLWSMAPVRRLLGGAAVLGAVVGGVLLYGHHRESRGFQSGYAVAYDSAAEATILRLKAQHARDTLRADSTYRVAQQSSAAVAESAKSFATAPRHTPRFEPIPVTVDTSMVGVFVESTGEHFILPRGAAQYWHTSDSLVTFAAALLQKYAAANKQWASAWQDEHNARIGADSLVSVYAEQLRARRTVPVAAKQHRLVYATVGAVVALIVSNQFRHR